MNAKTEGKQPRQSNLELLRVLSMLLVLFSHCDDFFGLNGLYSKTLGFRKLITDGLNLGGQIGVGCFILISGYFMVQQHFSLKRMLKLLGEVWFYTITIWLIWVIVSAVQGTLTGADLVTNTRLAFFPVLFRNYWFVTAYVILTVLSPFLNKLIFSLNRKEYGVFLSCLITIFVVIQGSIPSAFEEMSTGRLPPLVLIYLIAGYIRRFGRIRPEHARRHLTIALISWAALFLVTWIITFAGVMLKNKAVLGFRYFYRSLNSPFIVISVVELFLGFLELQIEPNRLINGAASCTFGVFLIHGNRLSKPLLSLLFPLYKIVFAPLLLVCSLLAAAVIYSVCSAIDWVRQQTVGRWWNNLIDRHADALQTRALFLAGKVGEKAKTMLKHYYGD